MELTNGLKILIRFLHIQKKNWPLSFNIAQEQEAVKTIISNLQNDKSFTGFTLLCKTSDITGRSKIEGIVNFDWQYVKLENLSKDLFQEISKILMTNLNPIGIYTYSFNDKYLQETEEKMTIQRYQCLI